MTYALTLHVKGKEQGEAALAAIKNGVLGVVGAEAKLAKVRQGERAKQLKREVGPMRGAFQAFAKGGFGGQIAGALGAPSKGLMALGLSAVAVGAVITSMSAAIQRNEDATRQVTEGNQNLARSIKDMTAAADSTALGFGQKNGAALASLAVAGNLDQAQAFARGVGPGGIAAAGTLQNAGMFNDQNLQALKLVSQSQQLDPDKAASLLANNRALASGSADDIARALILKGTGNDVGNVGAFNAKLGGTNAGRALASVTSAEGNMAGVTTTRFLAGGTERGLREEAGRIASPESAARIDFNRVQNEQLDVLKAIRDQQGVLAQIWLDFTSTEGSAKTRLIRAQNVTDQLGVPST